MAQQVADARLFPDAFYIGVGSRAVEPDDLDDVSYVDGAPVPWMQTRDSLIILNTAHNMDLVRVTVTLDEHLPGEDGYVHDEVTFNEGQLGFDQGPAGFDDLTVRIVPGAYKVAAAQRHSFDAESNQEIDWFDLHLSRTVDSDE